MDNYKNGDLVTWNYFNNKKTALNLTEVEAIRFQTAFTLTNVKFLNLFGRERKTIVHS